MYTVSFYKLKDSVMMRYGKYVLVRAMELERVPCLGELVKIDGMNVLKVAFVTTEIGLNDGITYRVDLVDN